MNLKRLLFRSLFVGCILALIYRLFAKLASVKPVSRSGSDEDNSSYSAIDTYVERQMRFLNIPGASLAIVEGDRIVHWRGFGKARTSGEAPSPQTPFMIGSLTKSFTALAILQLVEAGKIELDAPVQRYLPWFRVADPRASAQMTVRHLLNQTSGLPMVLGYASLNDFDGRPDAVERQRRLLSTLVLSRHPGARFEYCNLNYDLLGLIVAAASGESYADYIQRHILDPLDMRHTYTSKATALENGLAMGYRQWFGRPFPAPNLSYPPDSLPSGLLISSAEDMAHYLIANLNDGRYCGAQILSETGIAELHRGAAEWREMGFLIGYYGMGWISAGTGETRIVSHSGTLPDFAAFMALVPGQKKAIVLLSNANHAFIKLALDDVGMGATKRLAGVRPSLPIFGAGAWLMPGLLLIPLLQVAGVAATLCRIRHWRADPALRPSRGRMWGQHILLPLVPNVLVTLTLLPMLGKMRGFVNLYLPDFSWIALIGGSFAGVWSFLRTRLMLRVLGGSERG